MSFPREKLSFVMLTINNIAGDMAKSDVLGNYLDISDQSETNNKVGTYGTYLERRTEVTCAYVSY